MKIVAFKLIKYLFIILLLLAIFIVLYLFFAWLLSSFSTSPPPTSCSKKHTLYLSTNGVHMDIILPRHLLTANEITALKITAEDEYIAIGWGDKGFYLDTPSWAELKLSTALNAAFLLSETVMHVTHYAAKKEDWFNIEVCPEQLATMKKFMSASFAKDANEQAQLLEGAGYTSQDFFFKAVGSYTCFYTCNVWVNQALKKGKVKTAIWSPFDKGIIKHLPSK